MGIRGINKINSQLFKKEYLNGKNESKYKKNKSNKTKNLTAEIDKYKSSLFLTNCETENLLASEGVSELAENEESNTPQEVANETTQVDIENLLANCDEDVKSLILDNTYIMINGKEFTLKDALNNKDIDPQSYTVALNSLGNVLQDIKYNELNPWGFNSFGSLLENIANTPDKILEILQKDGTDTFSAIKNLKNEDAGFRINLYVNGWPRGEANASYDCKENTLYLKADMPRSSTFFHELIHASDDGKIINDEPSDADFVSDNPADSDLAGKIENYREDLTKEWIEDYDRFKDLNEAVDIIIYLGIKIEHGLATKEEISDIKILFEGAKEELKYFANKYWFIQAKIGEDEFEYDIPPDVDSSDDGIGIPYLLNDNVEIITWACQILKYGTPEQQDLIKNDSELMEIIHQWENIESH